MRRPYEAPAFTGAVLEDYFGSWDELVFFVLNGPDWDLKYVAGIT